jgi:NAD(P) transhydrogenase subunit alpha
LATANNIKKHGTSRQEKTLKIGIPKEIKDGEARVALIPAMISTLIKSQHQVFVEKGAGVRASFADEQYQQAGATLVSDPKELYQTADVMLKVQPPQMHLTHGAHEVKMMREGATLVGFLAPWANAETLRQLIERRITSFAMEYIPRITRAQSMDALSSMATVAGYKAVVLAAHHLGKMFPMMMTAAGTVPPAHVLVIGAGVAGLQAIATAKRLGAKVEAFDQRPAVKEQVKSLGASFIEMELPKDAETTGGYAKELSADFIKKEMAAIAARLPKVEVVICTAQIFGKRAPVLITEDLVRLLRPGSIIVDLAAEQGGNCAMTEAGKTVVQHGVTIIGAVSLAATLPTDASQMYSRNMINLFRHLYPKADSTPDFTDEIVKGACLIRNGEIVNEAVQRALNQK